MKTRVLQSRHFKSRLRRLARRYPAVLREVQILSDDLKRGERPGNRYQGVGRPVYRVRRANPSGRSGKSGGFRITYYVHNTDTVLLMAITLRREAAHLSKYEVTQLLRDAGYDAHD